MLRSLVAAPLIVGLGLLAPGPVSAQTPKNLQLANPSPVIRPLADLVRTKQGAEVERLLAAGRWEDARAAAQALLYSEVSEGEAPPSTVAADFALLALALAGLGDEAGAICRWHAAQAFDPDFLGADLSAYGNPGRLLEDHLLEDLETRKEGPPKRVGGTVERPVLETRRAPQYTELARKARVAGVVIVEAVIGEDGSVSRARVLKGLPFGLSAAGLDAVCDWRFKPATLEGLPVEVFYILTINFQVDVPAKEPAQAQ